MFNNIIVLIGCSLEGVFRCVLLLQGRQLPIYIQSVLSDYSFRFYPAFSSYLFIPLSASVFFPIFSFPICFRFLRFLCYLLIPYLLPLSSLSFRSLSASAFSAFSVIFFFLISLIYFRFLCLVCVVCFPLIG